MAGVNGFIEKIESLSEQTQDLAETAYKLARIEFIDHASKVISNSAIFITVLLTMNVAFLFIGFGVANWIGDTLNDPKIGFFIVGGFFVLLIAITLVFSKKIIIPYIRNIIVDKLYE